MIWKRSRTKSIFNGLPLKTIPKLFIVPWDCTIMVLFPSPILQNSGFLLQFRIRGTEFAKDGIPYNPQSFPMPQCWVSHVSFPLMLWDITLVNNLIQRATSMTIAAHLMTHDAGITWPELSHIFTCSSGAWFWSLRQGTFHNETRIVYFWCPLAIQTSLVQMPVKFMGNSVTPMRTGLAHLPSVLWARIAKQG